MHLSTVWVKKSPHSRNFLTFFPNGWEFLVKILHTYYTMHYKFSLNYLQLWQSYAILSATTIMRSKCPPLTETHAGWSHLIWHNFVKIGDNWIKMIWTLNRRVKFGLKIHNCLGKWQKMPACVSADGGHFAHMMWTGLSRLIRHNFVKVADNSIKKCHIA